MHNEWFQNWLRAHHHSEEQELNEHDYNVFFQELDLNKDRRISQSEMHSDVLQVRSRIECLFHDQYSIPYFGRIELV